jgi:hypothetical protein
MALKGHRRMPEHGYRMDFFMDEVAERGGVVVLSTTGSGAALDQAVQLVTYAAQSSGKVPVGIMLADMVNIDLTKYKLNQHKNEIQKGSKAPIHEKCEVLTNMYVGSPTGGAVAYLSSSGKVTPTLGNNVAATPVVGRFMGIPDEDGYVKLQLNLPTFP